MSEGWGMVGNTNEAYAGDSGNKADEGKAPLDLIPWESVMGAAKVFGFGAKKYAPRNWQGLSKSRLFAATFRHLIAWWAGEDNDAETGESHLYHAACCILMLASHHGIDDRPGTATKIDVSAYGDDKKWFIDGSAHGANWDQFVIERPEREEKARTLAQAIVEEESGTVQDDINRTYREGC